MYFSSTREFGIIPGQCIHHVNIIKRVAICAVIHPFRLPLRAASATWLSLSWNVNNIEDM